VSGYIPSLFRCDNDVLVSSSRTLPPYHHHFYPMMQYIAQTMLSQDVCSSVTRQYSIKMAKCIIRLSSLLGSHTILVFYSEQYGNIPMGTPLQGHQMQVGYEKYYYFWPVSRFTACCQCCKRQVLSTWSRRTVASWWHSVLIISRSLFDGWRSMTKRLWQESSMSCQK